MMEVIGSRSEGLPSHWASAQSLAVCKVTVGLPMHSKQDPSSLSERDPSLRKTTPDCENYIGSGNVCRAPSVAAKAHPYRG